VAAGEAAVTPKVVCAYRFEPSYGALADDDSADAVSGDERDGCPQELALHTVRLGDRVVVRVTGITSLSADARCADLRLYLDGLRLDGVAPESCDPGKGTVRFELLRNEQNRATWQALLGSPSGKPRRVPVNVGRADLLKAVHTDGAYLALEAVPMPQFLVFLALLALVLTLFFNRRLNLRSMLRDRHADAPAAEQPYSLARCQMAFWFFLVVASYVFIWIVLGELDTITGSVLTLIGIGSGTALGASMIDASKQQAAERAEATAALMSRPSAALGGRPVDPARLALAQAEAQSQVGAVKGHTKNSFFQDVLTDGEGYSFHRFQIFVWTVVLGIIFLLSVYRDLAMPQFSETLLGLMGISSGTYLGFKFPERFGEAARGGDGEGG
jgi:hypothetical protein